MEGVSDVRAVHVDLQKIQLQLKLETKGGGGHDQNRLHKNRDVLRGSRSDGQNCRLSFMDLV